VVAAQVGKDLTISELHQLAAELTDYLHKRGYLVATVYIPAQTVDGGEVEIVVVPGKYGEIILENQAKIADRRLAKMTAALQSSDFVNEITLERALLLIKDLPGIDVQSTLSPGEKFGTTDLTIRVDNTERLVASLNADNWGNRFTGVLHAGYNLSWPNLAHYGDYLQFSGQTAGRGQNNISFGYSLPIGYQGARLAFNSSWTGYGLGEEFAALNADGHATVTGLTLSYPFKRRYETTLYGLFGYEYKDLYDEIKVTGTVTPRVERIWKAGINGNFHDQWYGANSFALLYSRGDLSIKDATAAALDRLSTQTEGVFNKLSINYQRLQQLTPEWDLEIRLNSQLSDTNLDATEKLYLGGASGVRAFPQGDFACDQGLLFSVELKWLITKLSNSNNLFYLDNFYDYAWGQLNKDWWAGADPDNYRHPAAAGLGVVWARRNFNLRLDYALKLGSEQAVSDTDHSGRLWLQSAFFF